MEQLELLKFIVNLLEELEIPYMVVGSYASGAYGEPRFTQDIDVVVDLTSAQLDALIERLPSDDYYVSREAAQAAITSTGQFNIIHPESGLKIDFMIAHTDAWGREQLRRRMRLELMTGVQAYTARPEDVILAKMIYYREGGSEKHLRDIAGMLKMSSEMIDQKYVQKWAEELDVQVIWEAILRKLAK